MPAHFRPLLAVALLTTLAASACGSRVADEDVAALGIATTTSSPGVSAGESQEEAGGGSPSADSADGATPTTATSQRSGSGGSSAGSSGSGGGTTPTTRPAAAGSAVGAPAGEYEYDTEGETTTTGAVNRTDPMPATTTLTVAAADGARQRSIRDLRDEEGDGTVTETVVEYRADGVFLTYLKITGRGSGVTLTYEFEPSPPKRLSPADAAPGDTTAFEMDSTDGGIHAEVEIEIVKRESVTIGGTAVDTLVVRTHTVFSGDLEGETTSTNNVDPERFLTVREHVVTDANLGLVKTHSEYTAVLRSLEPR